MMSFVTRVLSSRKSNLALILLSLLLSILACDPFDPSDDPFRKDSVRAKITSPADGSSFELGDMILLEAEIDNVYGKMDIRWSSSLDGSLSDKNWLDQIEISSLSVGTHKITVQVNDDNSSAQDSITITILSDEEQDRAVQVLSVTSEKPATIEDLWAHEVAVRIKGDCPDVDDKYLPDEKPCKLMWDVYYDIDALALDLGFPDDPTNAWAEINLTGILLLKEIFGEGEMGYGTISAKGQLQDLTMTENPPGSFQLEGKIPIHLACQGEYLILHSSDGLNVLNDGGVDTTLEAIIKVDVSQRRLEIRYEEFPLEIPTGIGDGNTIENLRLDIALIWAEGVLKK
jgi:hypothetical protein